MLRRIRVNLNLVYMFTIVDLVCEFLSKEYKIISEQNYLLLGTAYLIIVFWIFDKTYEDLKASHKKIMSTFSDKVIFGVYSLFVSLLFLLTNYAIQSLVLQSMFNINLSFYDDSCVLLIIMLIYSLVVTNNKTQGILIILVSSYTMLISLLYMITYILSKDVKNTFIELFLSLIRFFSNWNGYMYYKGKFTHKTTISILGIVFIANTGFDLYFIIVNTLLERYDNLFFTITNLIIFIFLFVIIYYDKKLVSKESNYVELV